MKEVILAGRPNSGKSTLFNKMASAHQKVGNYAGCTVEKKTALVSFEGQSYELTDLPGLYSLKPNSLDEEVALGHLQKNRDKSFLIFVVDGNNLEQELVLPLMLKKQGFHLTIAVNMMDEVRANQKILNLVGMSDLAGIPFFPISAKLGEGIAPLSKFAGRWATNTADDEWKKLESHDPTNEELGQLHRGARTEAKKITAVNSGPNKDQLLERDLTIDRFLLNKFLGPVVFLFFMFILFQSIFSFSAPLSKGIQNGISILQDNLRDKISVEWLASLVNDGVLAGVGAVFVFVPQIAILFFLIGVLEYSGYLPRVAYMVDRLLKPYGLDGKVFIPLLSSVACAVPGIMATRTIESQRTRIITIMISPLMTCSARLPVYTLLISTFISSRSMGPFNLQGLTMFAMYMLGIVVALFVALILHKLNFGHSRHLINFIHLPHYRVPNWKELFRFVWTRVYLFMKKAGTIIAGMAIVLWFLLSFPGNSEKENVLRAEKTSLEQVNDPATKEKLIDLESKIGAARLESSFGGRLGKILEPVFLPLGFDWRLTIGIIGSLAAREVFVSTIGTVFSLGKVEGNLDGLSNVLKETKKADGTPAYTVATCLSLLVFFAFSLQCISTIGVARKETNSWKIPAIMFTYMFAIAYTAAFVAFHVGSAFLV